MTFQDVLICIPQPHYKLIIILLIKAKANQNVHLCACPLNFGKDVEKNAMAQIFSKYESLK